MPELQKLSHTHDQIIDWLIANPALPLSACAAHFQYTQPWLSTIIHSDLFQAKLHERQEAVFGEVALSVKDRITALAHDSLTRLHTKIMVEDDVDKLNTTAELTLKALGFGAPKAVAGAGGLHLHQTFVTKDTLAEARARMEGRQLPSIEPPALPASIAQAEGIIE